MKNWYYSARGQRLGPVSEEQLRELFYSGKLEPGVLVWCEGMQGWESAQTVLGEMPPSMPEDVPPIPMGESKIDLGLLFSNGWESLAKNWPMALLAYLIVNVSFLVLLVVLAIGSLPFTFLAHVFFPDGHSGIQSIPEQTIGITFVVLLLLLSTPILKAGLGFFFIEVSRGKVDVANVLSGYHRKPFSLILNDVIRLILILLGLCLFILPGIYLAVCYSYASTLVIDQKLGFWEALELSRKTVHRNWLSVFVIMVLLPIGLALLLAPLGLLMCCVGIYLTTPIAVVLSMFFDAEGYRQLFPQFQKPAK